MKTAVDTNVFVDILINSPRVEQSKELLRQAFIEGTIVICPLVYAELATLITDVEQLDAFLKASGAKVESFTQQALLYAGKAWGIYTNRRHRKTICPTCGTQVEVTCRACGRELNMRQHILTDFLIGAHAQTQADQLLSHDRDFIRRYFPSLPCLPT
jgi:hypothetical protein